ncbi:MAG: hypothetical protein ACRYFS_00930 [Janthinobacterium lividum]
MLDTRITPISNRTRRSQTSAQSEKYAYAARPVNAPRTAGQNAAGRGQAAVRKHEEAEPIRRPLPSARQSRLGRSEMRLMGLATACTALVCAMLLLYLAAYAHVTQLGIEQAQARGQLRQNQIRNELLKAERNTLESPQRIVAAATMQGMTPRGATPVDYIATQAVRSGAKQDGVEFASNWDQGNKGGTTEDNRAAASFNH